jgi:protein O-GlcNAc transferase
MNPPRHQLADPPMASTLAASQFEIAMRHHERAEFDQAERLYRAALVTEPGNAELGHCAGVLALQMGNAALAAQRLQHCVDLGTTFGGTHLLLGRALNELGNAAAAIDSYRRAVDLDPGLVDAFVSLGIALRQSGRLDEAEVAYRRAVGLRPESFEAQLNLGNLLLQCGKFDAALTQYAHAEALQPNSADVHYHIGKALRELSRIDESIDRFQRAITADPAMLEAIYNLGNALSSAGRYADAAQVYEPLIAMLDSTVGRPGPGPAREKLRRDAAASLAAAWIWCFRYDEAWQLIRDSLRQEPDALPLLEHALVVLPYRTDSAAELLSYYRTYQAALRTKEHRPWPRESRAAGAGRLRVGFVSGDFRDHSVSFFLEPVLQHHDHGRLHVTCYSSNVNDDDVTSRLRRHADVWRDVRTLNDHALAAQIATDGIDILVDLAGRTKGNRLGTFSLRPAPLQASYLGYPTYSGIPEIDLRITDGYIDPDDSGLESERPARMPGSMFCYRPPADAPPVFERAQGAPICFGSFNQVQKISEANLAAWTAVLHAVPGSRLILKAFGFGDPRLAARVRAAFDAADIDSSRIDLRHGASQRSEHLAMYGDIDIALDTFPYNGATTTCEALWMGVPVVSLAGETHSCRMGASILGGLGLDELVANCTADYVRTAAALARDADRLRKLRCSLRDRLERSPLRDERRFTRDFENLLEDAWLAHSRPQVSARRAMR